MDLISTPNRWSCLPCAFSMVCDLPLDYLLDIIGHDGSKILWPDLREPRQRQAFHIQECLWAARHYGYEFACYQKRPVSTPDGKRTHCLNFEDSFQTLISKSKGVLLGRGVSNMHAVAWDSGRVFDSSIKKSYTLPSALFIPDTFYKLI